MVMRIAFLDIDGVVCTTDCWGEAESGATMAPLLRQAIEVVNRICSIPGDPVRVVISSSWREGKSKERLSSHMQQYGFNPNLLHDDWRTGKTLCHRGAELAEWLSRHPEVVNYVVLDDQPDLHPEQCSHHVQPEFAVGLKGKHYSQARRILERAA